MLSGNKIGFLSLFMPRLCREQPFCGLLYQRAAGCLNARERIASDEFTLSQ